MAVSQNLTAPILVSSLVWLLVVFLLMYPLILVPGSGYRALTISVMLIMTLVNILVTMNA
jgi:hypothetical protein